MKNYKKELKLIQNNEERYIQEKALEYQEKFNIENSGEGWNDTTDGFRHVWGAAYLSLKYGNTISHIATGAHEYMETYQPEDERKMDEWNNALGREIAKELKNEYKNITKNIQWSDVEDLIAEKTMKKIKENKVITSTTDTKLQSQNLLFKLNAVKNAGEEKTASLRQKLLESREEKLARYTQRLAESSEKVAEREASHISLEELKAPQEARKQRVRDIIEGKVEFDENTDLSAYVNKKSKDNKIFTQEDIDSMSEEEKEKNKEAIFYQKQTIGIPTKEQADKAVAKGGMVYVSSYTRSDGTKVKSYYRSR